MIHTNQSEEILGPLNRQNGQQVVALDCRDVRILNRLQECRDRLSSEKKASADLLGPDKALQRMNTSIFPKFLVAAEKMSISDLKCTLSRSQTCSVLSTASTTDLAMKTINEGPGPTARSLPAQLGLGDDHRIHERELSPVSASECSLILDETPNPQTSRSKETGNSVRAIKVPQPSESAEVPRPAVTSATSRPPPPTPASPLHRSLTHICRRRRRKGAHIMEYVGDKNPSESSVASELLCEKVYSSSFYFPEITTAQRMKALGVARPDTTWRRKHKLRHKRKLLLQSGTRNPDKELTSVNKEQKELPVLNKSTVADHTKRRECLAKRAKTFVYGIPQVRVSEISGKPRGRHVQYILPAIQRPDLSQDFSSMDDTLVYPSLSRSLSLMNFPDASQIKPALQKEHGHGSGIKNMTCYKFQPPSHA